MAFQSHKTVQTFYSPAFITLLKEIAGEVKSVWPEEKPLILRVSASDYADGGIDIDEMIKINN